MPVPDVAVLVFGTTAEDERWKRRVNTKDGPLLKSPFKQYMEVEIHSL